MGMSVMGVSVRMDVRMWVTVSVGVIMVVGVDVMGMRMRSV